MTRKAITTLLLSLLFTGAAAQGTGGGMEYSYDDGNGELGLWGTRKKETYDVAIHIQSPELVGATVSGVTVYLPESADISALSVWLSKKLTLESVDGKKRNKPDITTQPADVRKAFARLYIPFDHPHTLTEEGVYAGYSFTADDTEGQAATPLLLSHNTQAGGFFIHSQKTYLAWKSLAHLGNLAMAATLTGVPENGASVTATPTVYTTTGKAGSIPVTVWNQGAAGVKSVEISCSLGGETHTTSRTLPDGGQLASRFGASTEVSVDLPALAEDGAYPVTLAVTKVNGQPNTFARPTAAVTVDARKFVPRHRVLLEEYTGTWCGNCPRGYAGIKAMQRLHPEDFIALAYHNDDPMEAFEKEQFPSEIAGYPSCTLDRGEAIDPYFGSSASSSFHIEKDWRKAAASPAPAEITVSARLSEDGKTVTAEATVTSPRKVEGKEYGVEYALAANGLRGEGVKWMQANDFSTASSDLFPEPEFAPFLGTGSYVGGLAYDDVAVASTRLGGTDTRLPATLEAYEGYAGTAVFRTEEVRTPDGKAILQDLRKLGVVAMLIDRQTGRVVNAAHAAVNASAYTGIRATAAADGTAETFCTDLGGRRIKNPAKGVYLLSRKSADGSVTTKKMVR